MACGAWCHVALPLQLQAPVVGHAKVGAAILPRLLVDEVWVLQKDLRELVAVLPVRRLDRVEARTWSRHPDVRAMS